MSKWTKGNFGYNKEYLNGFIIATIKHSNKPGCTLKMNGCKCIEHEFKAVNDALDFADIYVNNLINGDIK